MSIQIKNIVDRVRSFHCLKDPDVELPALVAEVKSNRARSVLEIGTWKGATSAALKLAVPECHVTTIDLPDPSSTTFNPHPAHETGIAYRQLGVEVEQKLISSSELWCLAGRTFDFIFIDADHDEASVHRDLMYASELLSSGGRIVVHDYTDPSEADRPEWTKSVQRAVDRFCSDKPFTKRRIGGWLVALDRDTVPRKTIVSRLDAVHPRFGEPPLCRQNPQLGAVLHVHLATAEEPQTSMCEALRKCASRYLMFDYLKVGTSLRSELLSLTKSFEPDLIFMQIQRAGFLNGEILSKVRELCDGVKIVNWCGDILDTVGGSAHWSHNLAKGCDLMLYSCMSAVRRQRAHGVGNAAYLQIGYDEGRYFDSCDPRSLYDVVFLGESYKRHPPRAISLSDDRILRDEAVAALLNSNLRFRVFGTNWGARNVRIPAPESPAIYHESRMALSVSYASDLERYSSDRLLRAMACGCTVLCKRFKDCKSWGLVDGENILLWDTVEQCVELAKSLSDDECRRIGSAGAKLVRTQHTWGCRMGELQVYLEALDD